MNLSIAIMAHPDRATEANRLAAQLGARIAFDTGAGQNANADFAWRLAAGQGKSDWCVVLVDDALPIADFRGHAEAALQSVWLHSPLVSFYTGTGRPRPEKVIEAIAAADRKGDAWLRCDALLWGVGVALPTELVPGMLDAVATHPKSRYDMRLGQWATGAGYPILYTNPSLVDHADTRSLLGHSREGIERRAHSVGTPRTWHTPATRIAARFE